MKPDIYDNGKVSITLRPDGGMRERGGQVEIG